MMKTSITRLDIFYVKTERERERERASVEIRTALNDRLVS